jgi:type II secretory pathway pseudopilin PulG
MIKTQKIPAKTAENNQNHATRGNAMVYVLIAIALFGFLTVALSRQNKQADGQDLSDEQVELYTNELIQYIASAQQSLDMMFATGTEVSDLDLVRPTQGTFNTGTHAHKIYHPAGGGLNYNVALPQAMFNGTLTGNWRINKSANIEWTPTTNPDVVLSNQFLKEEICAEYNRKVVGNENIPQLSNSLNYFFATAGTNDFEASDCAACEGYPTLCVQSSGGTSYGIYAILQAE